MKYVALDIGNVLCQVNFDKLLAEISDTFNISLEDSLYLINRNQKLHDLGFTSMKDELKHFGLISPVSTNRIMELWNNSIITNHEAIGQFNSMIKNDKLQVALLSNIGHEHAALMKDLLGADGFFENAIKHFSCDVGARKPTALYYQSFLMEHPEFEGCVYVDDVVENLEAGTRFGFRPYHFALDKMDVTSELAEIEKLILTPSEPVKNSRWH